MLIPAIAAAASVAGQAIGAYSAGRMNKRAEKFARESQARQRQEALSDWHMQNAYNDPSAQMQRLENAGLNPNLVYGNGAAAQTAQSAPRQSDTSQPNYETPKMDLGSVAFQAMQAQQMQANIAKTNAERERIEADTQAMLYNNKFLTPQMFESEYQARTGKAHFGLVGSEAEATIKKLQAEAQMLISGYDEKYSPLNRTSVDKKEGENLNLQRMQAEIQNIADRTTGQQLQNELAKYERDIIKSLGVSGNHASRIVQTILQLILLKSR